MLQKICILNIKINIIFWFIITLGDFVQRLRTSHRVVALILYYYCQILRLRNVLLCLLLFFILILDFNLNVSKTYFICFLMIIIKINLSLNVFGMLDTVLTALTRNAMRAKYLRMSVVRGRLKIICITNYIYHFFFNLRIHF